jgi:hypothetical protein
MGRIGLMRVCSRCGRTYASDLKRVCNACGTDLAVAEQPRNAVSLLRLAPRAFRKPDTSRRSRTPEPDAGRRGYVVGGRTVAVQPDMQMVAPIVAGVTSGFKAPGVHAGSGKGPRAAQLVGGAGQSMSVCHWPLLKGRSPREASAKWPASVSWLASGGAPASADRRASGNRLASTAVPRASGSPFVLQPPVTAATARAKEWMLRRRSKAPDHVPCRRRRGARALACSPAAIRLKAPPKGGGFHPPRVGQ